MSEERGHLELGFEHDSRERALERVHGLISQGTKGLTVLNGGAAVAMLALMQALIGKADFIPFKPFGVTALCFFLLGAFLSSVIFFFHYRFLNLAYNEKREANLTWIWNLLIASAVNAFLGGFVVVFGFICAL